MQKGECQISNNHARRYGVELGGTAYLQIPYGGLFKVLEAEYKASTGGQVTVEDLLLFECTVSGLYESPGGRDSDGTKDVVYLEIDHFFKTIAPFLQVTPPD